MNEPIIGEESGFEGFLLQRRWSVGVSFAMFLVTLADGNVTSFGGFRHHDRGS